MDANRENVMSCNLTVESGGGGSCRLVDKSQRRAQNEEQDCLCDPRLKIPQYEIDQASTLLKYTNPYKVVTNIRKTDIKPKPKEIGAKPESFLLTDNSPETQEVLDCIQEPRMWMKDGELWTQVVSPATTKRHEIVLLYDDVNRRLWKKHARPYGMCRVRYALCRQIFDELTRQVTVTCAERGLFLVRIRAEIKYTIQIYHYMWRDIMDYFDPIVEKSVNIQADLRNKVEELEEEIKVIQKEMEDVHWKTLMLEQEKAYERQATLEWYKCRIEEERLMMQRLATLLSVMTTGDFNINTEDILSIDEERQKDEKIRKDVEFDTSKALQLSDTLKELVNERKVAEGRTKTWRLLEDEIIWVKGEISKNRAYLSDILKVKEPLDFNKWFDALIQGQDDPTEIMQFITSERAEPSMSHLSADMDNAIPTKKPEKASKLSFMKWLMTKPKDVCRCGMGKCRHEKCLQVDMELLVRQAMTEYLYGLDDHPEMSFKSFFKKWLSTKEANEILAVSQFFGEKDTYHVGPVCGSAQDISQGQEQFANLCSPSQQKVDNPYEIKASSLKQAFRNKGMIRRAVEPSSTLQPSKNGEKTKPAAAKNRIPKNK